jgi:hypothetical protein
VGKTNDNSHAETAAAATNDFMEGLLIRVVRLRRFVLHRPGYGHDTARDSPTQGTARTNLTRCGAIADMIGRYTSTDRNKNRPVLNRLFGSALHERAEPAQRILGIQELAPDSEVLAQLVRTDPAAEVRAAAAARCVDLGALAAAWQAETEPDVRAALVASLGKVLADTPDAAAAQALLAADDCADAIRAAVAHHTQDDERRSLAIAAIRDENVLVDVALGAAHAPTRLAAAERVHAPEPLRRMAEAAQDKDRGVARIARRRLDALARHASQAALADVILAQTEALVDQPGPIVTAAVELERRWKALDLGEDPERRARWDAATRAMQARFDREHEQGRARAQLQRRLHEWTETLRAPPSAEALPGLRAELVALRALAQEYGDAAALSQLDQGEQQLAHWEQARQQLAGAEALVIEAEQLAAGTPIDDAQLPQRWQALELAVRTPALTRRFEAALLVIEQRRLAYVRAAQEQAGAARQQLHTHLHAAEQALAAGHLEAARAAADGARALKPAAGLLPKPTVQRLSRVMQQLVELERWQSFGQHSARVQLCERAEGLAGAPLDPAQLAAEVQKLRAEWKTLDKEHANVPKSLWQRFDAACEKAYAPAARHFAELAAQRKQARKQREEFVAAAAAHAVTLMNEPHDLRAIAHWLRETDQAWHGADLGSVEPGAWKKIDAQLKDALAPVRGVLAAARNQAKAERTALIEQATALAAKAMERETPGEVRALQARWKELATATPLAPRDERVTWEQFRGACDAVFSARDGQRRQVEQRKHEHRRALEVVCEQLEQLAQATDKEDGEVRRVQRELQTQWKGAAGPEPVPAALDARFRSARTAVDAMLAARTRAREATVWRALAAKERLCEQLDALVLADGGAEQNAAAVATVQQQWDGLPPLQGAWEKRMAARRDAALRALSDEDARLDYIDAIEEASDARREALLELEMRLGLETPPDLRAQRLAVQVKQLRDRFSSAPAGGASAAEEPLIAWCTRPGVADARDRQRSERVFASLERRR